MPQLYKEIPVLRSSIVLTCKAVALTLLLCASVSPTASAQTRRGGQRRRPAPRQPRQPLPSVVQPEPERAPAVTARESEVGCGGFITTASAASAIEIVGAAEERERRVFAQGDFLYISAGAQHGVAAGHEFSVVRPRGRFRSKLSRKDGPLGVYTQEVGRVRVLRVRDRVSVAEVVRSCDNVLIGDLLRPAARRTVPKARPGINLDRFAEPTGKQTGRIVLARDAREMLSRDQVVFVDLGAEDNLRVGDYLTVFRPMKQGTFVEYGDEMAQHARRDFESNEFRGGKFSNQSQRLNDVDGDPDGRTVKTPEIRRRRPAVPRQVVGELVVLHVEGRTATAVITRVVQEVHTGDHVEVQ
jgi:hypothetical protein